MSRASTRPIAVVTGASSGIGEAVALRLAGDGYHVVLAARRLDRLEAVAAAIAAQGGEATAAVCDVTRRGDCIALARKVEDEIGPATVLVNNAGFGIFGAVETADPDTYHSMMETNYLGAVHVTQSFLAPMLERGRGSIVTVASICGIMGYAGMAGYCASKFALVGFMEALRDEIVDRGIDVSVVCPGTTETEFFHLADAGAMPAAERLLPRLAASEVAEAVARAARTGRPRVIIPWSARLYMKFKELLPRPAHYVMRRVSRLLARGRS